VFGTSVGYELVVSNIVTSHGGGDQQQNKYLKRALKRQNLARGIEDKDTVLGTNKR
jgi:hypothetical protein